MVKVVATGRGKMKGKRFIVGRGDTEEEARITWLLNTVLDPTYPCKCTQQWIISIENV